MNEYALKILEIIETKWKQRNKFKDNCKVLLPKIVFLNNMYYLAYPIVIESEDFKYELKDWIYQELKNLRLQFSLKDENDYIGKIDINKDTIKNLFSNEILDKFSDLYKYIATILTSKNNKRIEDNKLQLLINEYDIGLDEISQRLVLKIYKKDELKEEKEIDKTENKVEISKQESEIKEIDDKYSKETKQILEDIKVLEEIEKVDYNFEWNLVSGLRFASLDFIELCITLLKKGEFSVEQIVENDRKKIKILTKIGVLCNTRFSEEKMDDVILKEKIEKGEFISIAKGSFISEPEAYENFLCVKCKFSKCPKFYAGYILYLRNKGLLEDVLKDREEYRRNTFESDLFTIKWEVKDGVKKIPKKTFDIALTLLENDMVFVSQIINQDKKPLFRISLPFPCNTYKFISDDSIDEILKYKNVHPKDWRYVTRANDKLLYKCDIWSCAMPYCIFDVAGYLFYLKKTGQLNKIDEDRKYYEEHKDEIEREVEQEQKEQLLKFEEESKQKREREIKKILEYKNKSENIEQLVEKISTENGLHITIEGERGTGKTELANRVCELLKAYNKIDNSTPEYLSIHNLAFKNTYEYLEMPNTTTWNVKELSIHNKHLYVLSDIKEFIEEYKHVKKMNNVSYLGLKRINRVIDLITSLFDENYIILCSDRKSIDEFLALDSKIKFVYQNNRYEISNLPIDILFDVYCQNLNKDLILKLRNDKVLKENVKNKFIEYVSINAEFFPFQNEELAKYLANYSISKKDFIMPDNIYRRETVDESLDKIIGLNTVKKKIKEFEKYALYTVKAKNLGLKMNKSNLHMIFTGNPGTGKTTIARIMAKMLYDLGLVSENKLVEVERKDLVASYIGQTAPKTAEVVEKALGGVLFIDEAYTLAQGNKSGNDFGAEAVATLIKAMEDHKDDLVVIFAGYKDEMKTFLDINPGIASRIGYTFNFEDYTSDELLEMFFMKMDNMGYSLKENINKDLSKIFEYFIKRKNFGNGRFVDKLIQEVVMKHALREATDIREITIEDIPTIEDLNNVNYTNYDANQMLEKLVGLQELKKKIKDFENYIKFLKKAEEQNLSIPIQNLHMIFTGNPGTGKTTVARIIAKILFDLGIIHENKLVEVERKDLIAGYVGQTAIKTSEVIEKAMGGVLFIDEAYTLAQGNKSGNDFGAEAVATLIKAMEDHKDNLIVIFAGYKEEMGEFLNINPGISSRIGYIFDFPDYTDAEYCEIYYRKLTALGLSIEESAKKDVKKVMKYFCNVENNGNGRFVDKVVQNTLLKLATKQGDITIVTSDCVPSIQEMTKNMFAGERMINPEFIDEDSQRRTAIHEIGHATIRYVLEKTPGIKKITINAEGTGSLGYVEYNNSNFKYTSSKNQYLNRICGLLGGMCNEIVYLGEHESGNSSDLNKASNIVKNMITRYGMSSLGLYTFPNENNIDKYIYEEANKILSECYEKTIQILNENKEKTQKAIEYLIEKKEIDEEQFLKIMNEA